MSSCSVYDDARLRLAAAHRLVRLQPAAGLDGGRQGRAEAKVSGAPRPLRQQQQRSLSLPPNEAHFHLIHLALAVPPGAGTHSPLQCAQLREGGGRGGRLCVGLRLRLSFIAHSPASTWPCEAAEPLVVLAAGARQPTSPDIRRRTRGCSARCAPPGPPPRPRRPPSGRRGRRPPRTRRCSRGGGQHVVFGGGERKAGRAEEQTR